ncbi:mechanosensitive ion channel domain-containing protein [Azospirillum rugosum]|uniref:Small conductance mechanosensitive channel n=1 Tax=Azospirillum rugosum TaxID=416170 RepID=A0ABS4SUH6_9PROT|nr:mechanosensitive ion channel domain-containing protein [Azospirillum rugosum]MBP2296220.1 small conductance mechanosensitive channel [Azospirillum rugosum]MDQ0527095.1 small conductance mechanosensitive channel [Azospirillum rugosum]
MASAECVARAITPFRHGRRRATAAARIIAALLLVVGLAAVIRAVPASAQIPAVAAAQAQAQAKAQPPDPKEIGRLMQTLEDPARREDLLAQLRALQQAEQATDAEKGPDGIGTRLLTILSERLDNLGSEVSTAGDAVLNAPQGLNWLKRQVSDPELRSTWEWLFIEFALIIAAGHAARSIAGRILRRPRALLGARPFKSAIAKVPLLLVRAVLDVGPIAAFAAAGFGALVLIEPPPVVRLLGITYLNASIFVQFVFLGMSALLAPDTPNLRLLPMGDAAARRLMLWSAAIAITTLYGMLLAEAARRLGLPPQPHATLVKLVGLAAAGLLAGLVLRSRADVASWLRGEIAVAPALPAADAGTAGNGTANGTVNGPKTARPSRLLRAAGRRIADVWHAIAILYIIVLFGIWALEIHGGFVFVLRATVVSLVTVGVARFAGRAVARLSQRLLLRFSQLQGQPKAPARTTWGARRLRRYIGPSARLVQWSVALVAGLIVLDVWGLDVRGWLQTAYGWRIVASSLSILLVVAVALAVWEVSNAVIERHLSTTDRYGRAIQRSARVRTLLPLLRNALMVVLLTFVVLIALSELGLNIGPLLAGAGVVGLAVGFGAQTLVKDVITGLFILFEDTIAIGDVVNVAGKGGLVEGITIRTLRLRDFDGTVHTIPFSAVTSVSNMTKDFSYYVFDVTITHHESVDRVVSVLQEIGEGLRADPRFAPLILESLEVLGVDAFRESSVLIKARIKTLPIQQWNVGREFNGRMKKRFNELGIQFPFPQRILHVARYPEETFQRRAGAAE